MKYRREGFTLIELLVVMAIIGILSSVGISNFRSSQVKARDAKRKSDLEQIQRALEIYLNDKGNYPVSDSESGGKISAFNKVFDWGDEFSEEFDDPQKTNTVYMKELPDDPLSPAQTYCYKSDGSFYQLYAKLENSRDPSLGGSYFCGSSSYNYGVSSSNTSP